VARVPVTTLPFALLFAPPPTASDDPAVPTSTLDKAEVTTGSTEIEGQGKAVGATVPKDGDRAADATELNISAGGLFSTGNARSIAITGLGKFRIRRKIHQFSAGIAGNYGRAAADVFSEPQTNLGNVQGMARYEVFFHPRWSAFLQSTARHDPFQGLLLRLNVDPGIAFYALNEAKHLAWFEGGYDFQFDVRTEEARWARDPMTGEILPGPDGEPRTVVDKTLINHAVRLFFGYTNNLNEHVTFDTGFEYLQSVIVGRRFRLNWVSALSVSLGKRFALATTFTLRYENLPLPNVEKLDTLTSVLLKLRIV
jgi:putative salt-induced outer membrane protein